ncbi:MULTISPECIES: restriction endonuclease [unclassified Microbulbifer]|uniref:restriction endonuclease n=1 Tax=unclassified Microbulbifer TaxID=2619833 RepID=UPI0027E46EEF|nr:MULTISPECIES: restriction endonuclease [unclassified Microbulbifer]
MSREFQDVDISPEQFELQVREWLQNAGNNLAGFSVTHLERLKGDSGEYEIDVHVEFSVFEQAIVKVLIECKKYKSPVKRDVIMVLESKIRDSNAHKGMVFSTSGFQSGAIEYASRRGIATIGVQHGHTNYFTKSLGALPASPPPWVETSDYIGWFIRQNEPGVQNFSLVETGRTEAIHEWLNENA